jgi:hypothetical protein
MLGYDYEIIYKKRKENVVVDAPSRKYEEEGSIFVDAKIAQILCFKFTFLLLSYIQTSPSHFHNVSQRNYDDEY